MSRLKLCVCFVFVVTIAGFELYRSAAASGQTTAPSLAVPIGITATDNLYNDKVGIYWEPIWGATNYRVFRNTANDPATATDVGTTAANLMFDASAGPNQTFFYWVRAENSTSVSPLGSPDTGIRTSTVQLGPISPLDPPPAPPANPVTAA